MTSLDQQIWYDNYKNCYIRIITGDVWLCAKSVPHVSLTSYYELNTRFKSIKRYGELQTKFDERFTFVAPTFDEAFVLRKTREPAIKWQYLVDDHTG